MTKKNIKYTAVIITLLSILINLIACKKVTNAPVTTNDKVQTVYDSGSAILTYSFGYTTFTYDANGRQIKAQYSSSNVVPNSTNAYDTFIYSSGSVTDAYICPGGCGNSTTTYSLNSQGLATSDNLGDAFLYDANGHLILANYNSGDVIAIYTYANANLITEIDTGSNGDDTLSYLYSNKTDNRDCGLLFQGKLSANLVSAISGYSTCPGENTVSHSYKFDSKGRVIEEDISPTPSICHSETEVLRFTYY